MSPSSEEDHNICNSLKTLTSNMLVQRKANTSTSSPGADLKASSPSKKISKTKTASRITKRSLANQTLLAMHPTVTGHLTGTSLSHPLSTSTTVPTTQSLVANSGHVPLDSSPIMHVTHARSTPLPRTSSMNRPIAPAPAPAHARAPVPAHLPPTTISLTLQEVSNSRKRRRPAKKQSMLSLKIKESDLRKVEGKLCLAAYVAQCNRQGLLMTSSSSMPIDDGGDDVVNVGSLISSPPMDFSPFNFSKANGNSSDGVVGSGASESADSYPSLSPSNSISPIPSIVSSHESDDQIQSMLVVHVMTNLSDQPVCFPLKPPLSLVDLYLDISKLQPKLLHVYNSVSMEYIGCDRSYPLTRDEDWARCIFDSQRRGHTQVDLRVSVVPFSLS
mmetsp:Transcript_19774/g.32414  ORF Transcript_19774/g.32414 Transcript_19774/m.32414 type:complete len:388 (+) Transcript_19774:188-1351(+)